MRSWRCTQNRSMVGRTNQHILLASKFFQCRIRLKQIITWRFLEWSYIKYEEPCIIRKSSGMALMQLAFHAIFLSYDITWWLYIHLVAFHIFCLQYLLWWEIPVNPLSLFILYIFGLPIYGQTYFCYLFITYELFLLLYLFLLLQ